MQFGKEPNIAHTPATCHVRSAKALMPSRSLRLLASLVCIIGAYRIACSQEPVLYHRIYLKDKGTPARFLAPDDSLYRKATVLLSARCLQRRARLLMPGHVVSTEDLPLYTPYLDAIEATGATIAQSSRWMNTVMVVADSAAFAAVKKLSFIDSAIAVRPRRRPDLVAPKIHSEFTRSLSDSLLSLGPCLSTRMGLSSTQNRSIHLDDALRLGFAGEGVIVGILDAGFDWRSHEALRNCTVLAERDFIFGDDNTADEGAEDGAESHGTQVMSLIGGGLDGAFVGGAPHAAFVLAKTEDIRSEKHVEEDNFVAGLEWMESLGVDVTNTSLSYTSFDAPEAPHLYSELDGKSAFASRAVNKAVGLGMICVVAAGNDGAKSYRYVGVPAEADSAIAVAAVDSNGIIARFSSRGFPGRRELKPDVAAMGVANRAADHRTPNGYVGGQGTSYASPLVTAAIAILLSARPGLTPWEVRAILYRASSRSTNADTAYGHGIVNLSRALDFVAESAPIAGIPRLHVTSHALQILASVRYHGPPLPAEPAPDHVVEATVTIPGYAPITIKSRQPLDGIASWSIPRSMFAGGFETNDTALVVLTSAIDGTIIRQARVPIDDEGDDLSGRAWDQARSTLCYSAIAPPTSIVSIFPNPVVGSSRIAFQSEKRGAMHLILYAITGAEASLVLDVSDLPQGEHVVDVQTLGLASGAYVYALEYDDCLATGKVIVLGR